MTLSELMLAELRYIYVKPIPLSQSRRLHQTTLKSLLNRKLIRRIGNEIHTTDYGNQIVNAQRLNKRKHESDVSDSVKALLHVSKILPFKNQRVA